MNAPTFTVPPQAEINTRHPDPKPVFPNRAVPRVRYECNDCQSQNVTSDATAIWDVDSQSWQLCAVLDEFTCEDCESDDVIELVMPATLGD